MASVLSSLSSLSSLCSPQAVTNAAWLGLPLASYYLVRPLSNPWLRAVITPTCCAGCCPTYFLCLPCANAHLQKKKGLLYVSCKDLPLGSMATVMKTSLYWIVSIRLTSLMLLPNVEVVHPVPLSCSSGPVSVYLLVNMSLFG